MEFNKGKFLYCRLRVEYSDGEKCRAKFVSIPENSTKEDRIKAIKTIKGLKTLLWYWVEDKYENAIGRFGEVLFNQYHVRVKTDNFFEKYTD